MVRKRPDKQVKRVRSDMKRVKNIALIMYHLDHYVQVAVIGKKHNGVIILLAIISIRLPPKRCKRLQ